MHLLEKECFSLPWSFRQCQLVFGQQHFSAWGFLARRQLIAYLSVYHVLDEMEIVNLAVTRLRRRQNLGTRLLKFVLQEAAKMGIQKTFLEVRESNLAAIALYKKCGFTQNGRRKAYYPDSGEDALVFTREN